MYESNSAHETTPGTETPCILCLSWDKRLVLVNLGTADLMPGDTLRDKIGNQLLSSLPEECNRLANSLNYLARNALGMEMIREEYKVPWLRDHLGQAVERALYRGQTLCEPWQTVMETQVRRMYGLVGSPREPESPRTEKTES